MTDLRIDQHFLSQLRCPVCGSKFGISDEAMICSNAGDSHSFPIVDGVPILINEANSVFAIRDYLGRKDTFLSTRDSRLRKLRKKLLPSLSRNIDSESHYRRFAWLVAQRNTQPRVLVIGGGILGQGMRGVFGQDTITFLETDISMGPRTQMICDAHDLPFADGAFDGVIAQAVLEHVVDPYRCVAEIQRVTAEGGLIYAETPFMQQVHGGRYDFTRFTHVGHRRLFRHYKEVESGVICGPGMALAWAWRYFLLSFVTSTQGLRLMDTIAHFSAFWWKYFDSYLAAKPGALDAASGYYFLGEKCDEMLSDQALLQQYRGQM